MAIESVNEISVVPGLNDLFPSVLSRPKNAKRMAQAAANVHLTVANGIAAIGGLLSSAAEMDPDVGEVSRDDLRNLGLVLAHLGETAELMHHMHSCASDWMREDLTAALGGEPT